MNDESILTQLADLIDAADPPPPGLADKVIIGLTLDALHAEVAQLQHAALAGVRHDTDVLTTDTVTFVADSAGLMITSERVPTVDGHQVVRLHGYVAPQNLRVVAHTVDGEASCDPDENGRVHWEGLPPGPVRFVMWPPDGGRPVVTPSVEV